MGSCWKTRKDSFARPAGQPERGEREDCSGRNRPLIRSRFTGPPSPLGEGCNGSGRSGEGTSGHEVRPFNRRSRALAVSFPRKRESRLWVDPRPALGCMRDPSSVPTRPGHLPPWEKAVMAPAARGKGRADTRSAPITDARVPWCCHSRESGNPGCGWTPACAGVTTKGMAAREDRADRRSALTRNACGTQGRVRNCRF
jgi:hypothetical protein